MSRCRRRADGRQAGFGLVEIMVAMGLFALAALATAPLLIGALASSGSARLNLQAKALGQERLERLRNLPFHVGRQNGAYIDLLDTYFRDVNTSVTTGAGPSDVCSSRRYVSATASYECTINNLGTGFERFSQVVTSTFLNSERATVVPPTTYTSQTAGSDAPAANLLGVQVLTRWMDGGKAKEFAVRSYVGNEGSDQALLRASLEGSGLRVQGNLSDGDVLELRGGLLTADASLTTGSRVALGTTPGRISLGSGTTLLGANLGLVAPPDAAGASPSDPSSVRLNSNCDLACFGPSAVTGDQSLKVTNGLPRASTSSTPVKGTLDRVPATAGSFGFAYSNVVPTLVDTVLGLTGPIVSATGGSGPVATSSGWLDGTGAGSTAVRTSATVSAPYVAVNPTSFAPNGVVQLQLASASMTCVSGAGTGSVTTTWSGKVRWMTPTGNYAETELKPGGAQLPNPATTLVRAGETLDRYVSAWSAVTDPTSAVVSSGRTARGELAGVVSVLTANTRAGDSTSPITVTLGALACLAEDNR